MHVEIDSVFFIQSFFYKYFTYLMKWYFSVRNVGMIFLNYYYEDSLYSKWIFPCAFNTSWHSVSFNVNHWINYIWVSCIISTSDYRSYIPYIRIYLYVTLSPREHFDTMYIYIPKIVLSTMCICIHAFSSEYSRRSVIVWWMNNNKWMNWYKWFE